MLSAIEMLLPLIAVVLVVGPLGLMFAGKLNVKNASKVPRILPKIKYL